MEKLNGYVPLRSIAKSVMNELKVKDFADYENILQLVVEGALEINIHSSPSVEVKYLTVPASGVVKFPTDMLYYTKIGVRSGGRVWTLTLNREMVTPARYADGENTLCEVTPEDIATNSDPADAMATYGYVEFFQGQAPLYGISGGVNSAYYNVDYGRRTISISGSIPSQELILEYVSTGITVSGATMIPRTAVPAIKAYTHWKYIEYDPRFHLGDKQRKERLYDIELVALADVDLSFTMDEFLDTIYSSSRQTIKR
jgi:hypothetical protein